MNKEELLKNLFLLPSEDIIDIFEIINGYKTRLNKSKKDTLLIRMLFASGYHSTKEFYIKNKITKDASLSNALNYETSNILDYLVLRKIFKIDDDIFLKILNDLERLKSGKYEWKM